MTIESKLNTLQVPNELIPSDPRFGSGPSLIPKHHLEMLTKESPHLVGTSHRKSAVIDLVKEIHMGFRKYFNIPKDYEIIMGNGGATFLWDMIGLGLVEKQSTHFTCGEFSQKWYAAHKKIPWLKALEIAAPYGKGLQAEYKMDSDVICTTLNETSTGVQNTYAPKKESNFKNSLLLVDATSGAGQIPWDIATCDLFYFSPQKVFAGEGGLFVGFLSPQAKERALKIHKDTTRYIPEIMNWQQCLDYSSKFQTYNTPSITNLILIREQLKEMNNLTQEKIVQEAKAKANFVYNWATSSNGLFKPYIEETEYRSTANATIDVMDSVPTTELVEWLKSKKYVYDIDGYRKLGRNQLRISLFHQVNLDNLKKLTGLLSFLVKSLN